MSDPIRDLDDVEAIAWALAWPTVWAFSNRSCDVAAENADECVRLLRERRQGPGTAAYAVRKAIELAQAAVRPIQPSTEPRDMFAVGATIERAKVVAWLRQRHRVAAMFADHIARGEHDR